MTATQAHAHQTQARHVSASQLSMSQLRMSQLSASQRSARGVSAARLRLTRRGRLVLTSLAAGPLVALALVAALNGGVAAASSDLSTGTFEYVTVHAGQSLWELAESVAPASDPREVISDIVRLNQLENSELQPGDRLAIPAVYSN